MDLLSKTLIVAIVLVLVIVGAYYAFEKVFGQGSVTAQEAASLVKSNLQSHNPNAVVNITNVTQSQYPGSWHVVASFINDPTTPCPTYIIYSFDYPQYGFVDRADTIYTENCTINGFVTGSNYAIGSYPVAIVRSYSLKSPEITSYVDNAGYNNVVVHASYYQSFPFSGTNYTKVWLVNYSATTSNRSVYAGVSQVNGNLAFVYNMTH